MSEQPRDDGGAPPRVWPTLFALVTVPGFVFVAMVIAFVLRGFALGFESGESTQMNPGMIGLAILVSSTAFAAAGLAFAWLSPEPFRARLRLRWPPPRYAILFVLATPVIGALSALVDGVLFPEPTAYMQELLELLRTTHGAAAVVLFVAMIVVAPIGEELFFRGYVQTRLERRLPIVVAILIPAVVFTLIHLEVQHMVGVIPFALWAGYVVWHTQSLLVVVLSHAYNNALSVVGARFSPPDAGVVSDDPTLIPMLFLAALSLVPLVLALRLPRVRPSRVE